MYVSRRTSNPITSTYSTNTMDTFSVNRRYYVRPELLPVLEHALLAERGIILSWTDIGLVAKNEDEDKIREILDASRGLSRESSLYLGILRSMSLNPDGFGYLGQATDDSLLRYEEYDRDSSYEVSLEEYEESIYGPEYLKDITNRVAVAPLLAREMSKRPLSISPKKYLSDTLRDRTMYPDVDREGPRRRPVLVSKVDEAPEFYPSALDIPAIEYMFNAESFPGGLKMTFGEHVPMFAKKGTEALDVLHEHEIGLRLNEVYDRCPFIMYTYGLIYANIETLRGLESTGDTQIVPVLDNESAYKFTYRSSREYLYVGQWIDGVSLIDFIREAPVCHTRIVGDIVSVPFLESLRLILSAVFATIEFLFDELGFIHGDLHYDNIMIMKVDEPVSVEIPGHPGRYFNLDHVPILIDFEQSSVLRDRIIADQTDKVVSPVDSRIETDDKYVFDLDRFVRQIWRARRYMSPTLSPGSVEEFYRDITDLHFEMITGVPLTDSPIYPEVTEILTGDIASGRTPPLRLNMYRPRVIRSWIDRWSSSQEYPSESSPMNLEATEISTYAALMTGLSDPYYRHDKESPSLQVFNLPVNVPMILDSIDSEISRLNTWYNRIVPQLESKKRPSRFTEIMMRPGTMAVDDQIQLLDLVYAYRLQLLTTIRSVV